MFKFVQKTRHNLILIILWLSVKFVQAQVPFFFPMVETMKEMIKNIPSSHCTDDLKMYVHGIETHKDWAMKMYDATEKFPVGLLSAENNQLGDFDECVNVRTAAKRRIPSNASDIIRRDESVYGQYCLVEIFSNRTVGYDSKHRPYWSLRNHVRNISWALCVPSTCNTSQALTFFEKVFNGSLPKNELSITLNPNRCYSQAETDLYEITIGKVIFCLILVIYILFVIAATIYDMYQEYKTHFSLTGYTVNEVVPDQLRNAIVSFSLARNMKKLMEVRSKNRDLKLDCVCGIRSISMLFILAGHALIFFTSAPMINKAFRDEALQKVQNAIFLNNPLFVDTFLLISGFLMCCLLLSELEKSNGRVNFFHLYLGRFIRLTPSYIVVVMFYCTLLPSIGSGPFWKERMQLEQARCISSWWANVLYINNYVNTDQISWYLSVDTQLFLLAPAIIYPLWWKRMLGEVLLAIISLATVIAPMVITIVNHLDPTLMMFPNEINDLSTNDYFRNYYVKTHMRANAYLMGIVCGYIVHRLKTRNISFVVRILCGILAVIAGVGSMCSVVMFYQPDFEYSSVEAGFYAAAHRLSWCFAIGWTIIVCVTSNSYVELVLSWRVWAPFSKVSYSAYLLNGAVELYSYGTTRTPRYMSLFTLGCELCGHVIVTLILAFVFCVFFESPIYNLEKLVMGKRSLSEKSTTLDMDVTLRKAPSFSRSLPDSFTSSLNTMSVLEDDEDNKTDSFG